ncbi:MAG: DUF72 domain-containing protein [Candidatus Krumholzibacteria bacterium]|nr:DUF72 domain-containing protein [Candidatus Krumholzibacteria bacterium]
MENAPSRCAIRIGPAGWSYPDWVGPVYPAGKKVDELLTIARYFDCVELNSSFYRTPAERTVRSWALRISERPGFAFTVKVLSRFTHERAATPDDARRFLGAFEALLAMEAIGVFLFQFPWSFRDSRESRNWLENLATWFKDIPTTVELRHASWRNASAESFLAGRGLAFCNIDQPVIGSSMPPTEIVTQTRLSYIRLHGRNYHSWVRKDAGRDERYDYLYRENELEEWKQRAEHLAARVDNLYIITNNHFRAQALVNAFQLKYLLGEGKQRMPDPLIEAYPVLRSIAIEPPAQDTLLRW